MFWNTVAGIIQKDLIIERHTKQTTSIMLVFSLATAVLFNFALGAIALAVDLSAARNAAVGFLWSTILLAGTLGLNRSLSSEQDNQAMSALLMAPVDRAAIYVGKVVSLTTITLLVEAILVPVFTAFFNRPFYRPMVLLTMILGTIGFVSAGILVGSMSIQTRSSGVLLPVLLLPLTLPAVLSAATVTTAYMGVEMPAFADIRLPFSILIAYDILMLVAGVLTFHFVVEE
jgi:heme exporter protein B